jgi:hypothetical protein
MNKLIGVSGFARSGKDTFCERASALLRFHNEKCTTFSFARALKEELYDLLIKNTGISPFTEDPQAKEIIRPLLVTYGTEVRRKINPDCWIESIQSGVNYYLNKGYYVFISDVRFLNEAEWVKENEGYLFNITRSNIKPANKDEETQFNLLKNLIDYKICWPTFESNDKGHFDDYIIKLFSSPSENFNFFPKNYDFIDVKSKLNLEYSQ